MKKEPYHQPLLTRHSLMRAVVGKAAGECALLLVCPDGAAQGVQLTMSQAGTNLVLSWPVSATNAVLQSSSSAATGWTAVASAPVTNQQVVSVMLPMASTHQFFRLKLSEKSPVTDKDPSEKSDDKDPISDKDPTTEKPPSCDKSSEGP